MSIYAPHKVEYCKKCGKGMIQTYEHGWLCFDCDEDKLGE